MANGTPFLCSAQKLLFIYVFFLSGKLGIFAVTRSKNLFKKEIERNCVNICI